MYVSSYLRRYFSGIFIVISYLCTVGIIVLDVKKIKPNCTNTIILGPVVKAELNLLSTVL